jgi:putative ABC transport system ATP-binding protein
LNGLKRELRTEHQLRHETAMISTTNLTKVYRTDAVETTALNNVAIEIAEGEFVSIMGPSGCGKSTLLNILGLLDSPSAGSYSFGGREVGSLNERQRAGMRKGNIGFIFQSFNLIDELTVWENVELPLLYLGTSTAERKERVGEALDRTQIGHRADHYPQQLSGGQQQRVAVARAVVASPRLILADEPTGNLDSTNGQEVMNLLRDLNEAGTTIAMVTHSPSDAEYSERIIHLFDGKVVEPEVISQQYLHAEAVAV